MLPISWCNSTISVTSGTQSVVWGQRHSILLSRFSFPIGYVVQKQCSVVHFIFFITGIRVKAEGSHTHPAYIRTFVCCYPGIAIKHIHIHTHTHTLFAAHDSCSFERYGLCLCVRASSSRWAPGTRGKEMRRKKENYAGGKNHSPQVRVIIGCKACSKMPHLIGGWSSWYLSKMTCFLITEHRFNLMFLASLLYMPATAYYEHLRFISLFVLYFSIEILRLRVSQSHIHDTRTYTQTRTYTHTHTHTYSHTLTCTPKHTHTHRLGKQLPKLRGARQAEQTSTLR